MILCTLIINASFEKSDYFSSASENIPLKYDDGSFMHSRRNSIEVYKISLNINYSLSEPIQMLVSYNANNTFFFAEDSFLSIKMKISLLRLSTLWNSCPQTFHCHSFLKTTFLNIYLIFSKIEKASVQLGNIYHVTFA